MKSNSRERLLSGLKDGDGKEDMMNIHKIEQRRKQEKREKIISIMMVMTLTVIREIIKIYVLIKEASSVAVFL